MTGRNYFYGGVFLLTLSTLMLEILQTRILSVAAWYHLAFMAISMAMFGMTAGAVWVYVKRDRFTVETFSRDLTQFAAFFAISIVFSLFSQLSLALVDNKSTTVIFTWFLLSVFLAVPFFFSGVAVSLALTRSPFPIGWVYAVDLFGAAAGCLCVLVILNLTDGPSAVIWVGVIAALSAISFQEFRKANSPKDSVEKTAWWNRSEGIAVVFAIVAYCNGNTLHGFQPLIVKDHTNVRSHPLIYERWNTFSRICLYDDISPQPPDLWGKSIKLPPDFVTRQWRINIDGAAGTSMPRFSGKINEVDFLRWDVTNLAYFIRNSGRSAVVGVGGGRDVLAARNFGFKDITGIEINPTFVYLLTKYPRTANTLHLDIMPEIHIVTDEARSWFARSPETFDLIQISMIDTWASTSAGAFTLSENGLYTVEAWKIFLKRLNPQGVLTVSRWYAPGEVNETGRLMSLAVLTLLEMGAIEPKQHIFLASAENHVATLLLSPTQFLPSEIETLHRVVKENGYTVLIAPDEKIASPVLDKIVSTGNRQELYDFTSKQLLDLTPPTDNKPFFFNQLSLKNPGKIIKLALAMNQPGGVIYGNLQATYTLMYTLLISLCLVILVIVLPLQTAVRNTPKSLAVGGTVYFSLLGLGFMFAEMGLIQSMSIFLGHPVYSLSVVLFSLILATGIGSYISEPWALNTRFKFSLWVALLCTYLLLTPFILSQVVYQFQSYATFIRILLAIFVITPMGILMGFGFPTGMKLVEARDAKPTPWFWGINGATGVLASGLAVAFSISFGIHTTLRLGAIAYLLLIPTVLGFRFFETPPEGESIRTRPRQA